LGRFFSESTAESGGYAGFRQLNDLAQIENVLSGRAYIDIHTARYPEGEIRGQLLAIPEPAVGALGCVAVACALFLNHPKRTRRSVGE
jgi:hypothetical protein